MKYIWLTIDSHITEKHLFKVGQKVEELFPSNKLETNENVQVLEPWKILRGTYNDSIQPIFLVYLCL